MLRRGRVHGVVLTMATTGYTTEFDRRVRERVSVSPLLLLPIVALEIGYFVVPFVLLVRISLYESTRIDAFKEGTWTLDNFTHLLTDDLFHSLFITTSEIALIATITTIVVGTFYAYVLWRAEGLLKTVLLVAMVLPLLTTLVVKLYALVLLLAPLGTINDTLIKLGLIEQPVQLMSNMLGVVIGLTYTTIPYAALPVYAVLENMDWEVVESARDLGAGKVRSFYEVVLPQATPGIIVSSVLAFVWNFGAYASPGLLGSGKERTLGIETQFYLNRFDWPKSAAISIIMMVVVIACTVALLNILGRQGGGMDDVT